MPEACVITPKGAAGIATIQVCGKGSLDVIKRYFQGTREPHSDSRLYYGKFLDDKREIIDEVLLVCYEKIVEIHCHGGETSISSILYLLRENGVCINLHEEWIEKKYKFAIERTAFRLFLSSRSELAAKVFIHQLQGALRKELEKILAEMDKNPKIAQEQLCKLQETARFGKSLAFPRKLFLVGAPNVGKSTLLNSLIDKERMLVDAKPGTTRDIVCESFTIDGIPFYIMDTAGIRNSEDVLENMGIANSKMALENAKKVIWVCDASKEPGELSELFAQREKIVVVNKIDLAQNYLSLYQKKYPSAIAISALQKKGLDNLKSTLTLEFKPFISKNPRAIVLSSHQESLIQEIILALENKRLDKARTTFHYLLQ